MKKTRFDGCTLTILGDSYSTFAGYNPEGFDVYYPNDGLGVSTVDQTWWHLLLARTGMTLLKNDSWSGSTVCTSVRPEHPVSAAFVRRMETTLNGDAQPDVILIFGGTNDSWTDCRLGENMSTGWTEETDRTILPAFCRLMAYAKEHNPQARVLCIVNTDLKDEIAEGVADACTLMGVQCLMLHDIDKEWGHPTALGMQQIADQVAAALEEA